MADGLQLGPPATSSRGWCCSYNQTQEEEEGRERLDGRGSHRPNITDLTCVRACVCVAVNMMFCFLLFLCLFDMGGGNHTGGTRWIVFSVLAGMIIFQQDRRTQ